VDLGVMGLLLAAVISITLTDGDRSAAAYELFSIVAIPLLFYWLLRLAPLGPRAGRYIITGWVAGALLMAVIGLTQFVLSSNIALAEGGTPRLLSVYSSPNSAGIALEWSWPLALSAFLWGASRRDRMKGSVALTLISLALGLTLSRGAILLGLPAAILTMGLLARGRYRAWALALVALGAIVLLPLLRLPRFASLLDLGQGSTFFRVELWRSTLAMLRDSPLLGAGLGQFESLYRTRYILPTAWAEPNQSHPHNIWLDLWTRLGILGIASGVALQYGFWRAVLRHGSVARASIKRSSAERRSSTNLAEQTAQAPVLGPQFLGLAGGMAAALAHGLVDNTLCAPDLTLYLAIALALVGNAVAGETTEGPSPGVLGS